MHLNDFQAPSALMKQCTGEHKIESFKTISNRLDKAADEIDRDADKLERALKGVNPDTEKLKKDFRKLADQMLMASQSGNSAALEMNAAAQSLRNLTDYFTRELREATETANALQNMYTTLGKAISKAEKSGNPRDAAAAEIAGKAYEKACKAAEKQLPVLAQTNKFAQKSIEQSARFSKHNYLNSAISLERALKRLTDYVKDEEKDLQKARYELNTAKEQLAWAKKLAK